MNNKERKLLYEFKQLLYRVPVGHTGLGKPSASLSGMVGAHHDLVAARTATGLFMTALICSGIELGEVSPEQVLAVFRDWFKMRAEDGWKVKRTDFYHYFHEHPIVNCT